MASFIRNIHSETTSRRTTRSLTSLRPGLVRRHGLRQRITPPLDKTEDADIKLNTGRKKGKRKNRTKPDTKNCETSGISESTIKREFSASDSFNPLIPSNLEKKCKVIIIGAGISGLACAQELIERKCYDVMILEARTRPGGRLKSVPLCLKPRVDDILPKKHREHHPLNQRYTFLNTPSPHDRTTREVCQVDTGGAFIHGTNKNPIYDLCKRINILTSHAMKGDECLLVEYHNAGWPVSAEIDWKVQKRFNHVLDQAFKMSKQIITMSKSKKQSAVAGMTNKKSSQQFGINAKGIELRIPKDADCSTSFGSLFRYIASGGKKYCSNHYNTQQIKGGYPAKSMEACLFQWHVLNLEMSCGVSLDKLGLKWNEDEQYAFDGDHVILREGFGCMVESLANGLNIKYGMEVTGIRIKNIDDTLESEDEVDNQVTSESKSNGKVKRERGDKTIYEDSDTGKDKRPPQIRRSNRSNKGQFLSGRLNIGALDDNQRRLGTYDDIYEDIPLEQRHRLEGAAVEEEEIFSKVEVEIQSGLVLEADAVICTLPLGILEIPPGKPGHVKFDPPLPKRKQDAISCLGFGRYNKCALSFPFIFWNSSDDFTGVIGSPVAGTNILICNVSVVNDLPVIVIIFGGSYAEYMENLTDETIVYECMDVVKRVWGSQCRGNDKKGQSSFSASGNSIPNPIDYVVTRWGKDRYARGAFSFVPPGVDGSLQLSILSEPIYDPFNKRSFALIPGGQQNKKAVNVFEPYEAHNVSSSTPSSNVKRPLIMFAGEATTKFHPATIHGAFLSGVREAYRLDLAVEPELNNNIVFDDNYLYQPTFSVRKRLDSTVEKLKSVDQKCNQPQKHTIRARKLRRKSKLLNGEMVKEKKTSGVLHPYHATHKSIRKSTRCLRQNVYPCEVNVSYTVERNDAAEKVEQISKEPQMYNEKSGDSYSYSNAEDVAILRGTDSFGSDDRGIELIKAHMFPIPQLNNEFNVSHINEGAQRKTSIQSIQSRYKELVSAGADFDVSLLIDGSDSTILESSYIESKWKAPRKSYRWWSSFGGGTKDKISASESKILSANKVRKSLRRIKPKVVFDM